MTKEMLNKYRDICAEIADKEAELNDKHYAADTIKVCTPPSYTAHSKRIEGYLPSGNTVTLLAELSTLRAEQRACEEWINKIPKYSIRKAAKIYYLSPIEEGEDKLTWEDVADKIGNGTKGKALEVALARFLKTIK